MIDNKIINNINKDELETKLSDFKFEYSSVSAKTGEGISRLEYLLVDFGLKSIIKNSNSYQISASIENELKITEDCCCRI